MAHTSPPPVNPGPPDDRLIERYLAGECTLAEQMAVRGWMARNPEDALVFEVIRARFTEGAKGEQGTPLSMVRERVYQVIGGHAGDAAPRGNPAKRQISWRLGISAVVALIALVVMLGRIPVVSHSTRLATGHAYVTHTGERATLKLADGTRVRLAPRSRLDVAPGFGTTTRMVFLSGEAYFDVTAFGRAPFLVRTGNITTRVLGTTFDVRRYAIDRATQVAVVHGRVAVETARVGAASIGRGFTPPLPSSIIVTKNMVATITDSSVTNIATNNITQYTVWTNGQLMFDDVPVSSVLATLGRWYGYTFRVTDSVTARQHISATFSASEPAAALKGLQLMLDVTMTFERDTVTLHPSSSVSPRVTERRSIPETYSTSTERGR